VFDNREFGMGLLRGVLGEHGSTLNKTGEESQEILVLIRIKKYFYPV
jgi:hypothetical protein